MHTYSHNKWYMNTFSVLIINILAIFCAEKSFGSKGYSFSPHGRSEGLKHRLNSSLYGDSYGLGSFSPCNFPCPPMPCPMPCPPMPCPLPCPPMPCPLPQPCPIPFPQPCPIPFPQPYPCAQPCALPIPIPQPCSIPYPQPYPCPQPFPCQPCPPFPCPPGPYYGNSFPGFGGYGNWYGSC